MAKIIYNSGHLAPIEAVSISYEPVFNENGDRLSSNYNITIKGKLLASKGSPTSSGTFPYPGSTCDIIAETGISETNWTESLLRKRCAVNNLFKDDYKKLTIGTQTAESDLTCYPKVVNISFEESDNPQYWPFNVTFNTDNLFCNGTPIESTGYKLRTVSETWDFNYDDSVVNGISGDNRIYNVSHSVSAQGLRTYNASGVLLSSGVDAARDYVKGKIGVMAIQPQLAISGFDNYSKKYNYVDTHSIDTINNSYSVTENWIYSTGSHIEEYTIESRTDSARTCPTVSINGTISGYAERSLASGDIVVSKYDNAKNYWDTIKESGLKNRAEAYTGLTLYTKPYSTSVSIAPVQGTINYSYEFRGGPTRQLTQANWENIQISTNFGEDIYTTVGILGGGEIIQKINTNGNKVYKTSITIDAIYPCSTGMHKLGPRFTSWASGELASLINQYNPSLSIGGVYYQVVDSQSESWNYYDSNYNRSITWVWQTSGVC